MSHHLRCYDYVNRPYAQVRDALTQGALDVFQRATNLGGARSAGLPQLHARLGPLEVATEVAVHVSAIEESRSPTGGPATSLRVEWAAAHNPTVFPVAQAVLSVYALSPTDTQLELQGTYQPPLGAVGRGLDAVMGHHIAEASVLKFIREVAAYLRSELPGPAPSVVGEAPSQP